MNLYLYGIGENHSRQWLMVDLGITFPGPREPGVDVILPDIRFIEEERHNLTGIVLTHAHEDHFGAVIDLWPRLRVPVFATPFTAALLKARIRERGLLEKIPVEEIALQTRFNVGPFDVELVTMAHSIPEPNALFIRTESGNILHSGDWKIDIDPVTGPPIDLTRLSSLGDEGVDVLVCDSTNALTEGCSPSEADVAESLKSLIGDSPNRVAVTTFASNVARIRSVLEAARHNDREVVVVGRAMYRIIQVASETGYLDRDVRILGEEEFGYLPREKTVLLCTGSQGEPRAAIARIASDNHPCVSLNAGDRVIFSSRNIPGNEKAIFAVQNALADQDVDVITDRNAFVHVSGHPRRGELEKFYNLVRPTSVIPMHGEALHLQAHKYFAENWGVERVIPARNGDLVGLAPGPPEIIDEVPVGRQYRDGRLILTDDDDSIRQRRKLSFAGTIIVALVTDGKGNVIADPIVSSIGIPYFSDRGDEMEGLILDSVHGVIESMPRLRRKSTDFLAEAVRRGVRATVNEIWGKKPDCRIMVSKV